MKYIMIELTAEEIKTIAPKTRKGGIADQIATWLFGAYEEDQETSQEEAEEGTEDDTDE